MIDISPKQQLWYTLYMNKTHVIEQYFFLGLLIASAVLVVVIFFPYVSVIILGVALSVLLYPLYQKINGLFPKRINWLASIITILTFLVILGIPLLFLGSIVFNQFQNLYSSLNVVDSKPLLSSLAQSINNLLPTGFSFDVQREITNFVASLSGNIKGFFTATLHTVFMLLLAMLTVFYFLKDGVSIRKKIVDMSPLDETQTNTLLKTLTDTINGIMKGYIAIGIAQGLLMGIGLALFGVPHPALWGVVTGIASMVPMIGTAFVSVPAIVYLLIVGSDTSAIGLGIWALTLVGTIDNFLNPLIIGKQTDLPPLVILFSVLGGITMLGPIGILVGPLAVSFFRALLAIYRTEK
jgi:predicted PurR-regulated permease PerM